MVAKSGITFQDFFLENGGKWNLGSMFTIIFISDMMYKEVDI